MANNKYANLKLSTIISNNLAGVSTVLYMCMILQDTLVTRVSHAGLFTEEFPIVMQIRWQIRAVESCDRHSLEFGSDQNELWIGMIRF